MAVTSTKNPREIIYGTGNNNNAAQQQAAQNQHQASTYKPSAQVQQYQNQLQQVQAQKPQGYNSKYGAQLDGILQQITNPEKFKFDFNGDEMFKYYADQYTQKGRQASMDAMGQAAALTGGYGNSYAQQVGNQAYDQYLMDLYAKGDQMRQEAYQRYQDDRADRYNQLNALGQADERDYGRYRDTVSDWERDRGYYTDLYNNERNFDYGTYQDQRDYDEKVRQFNESLNWDKMSQEQKYAAEYAMQLLAIGQTPSDELLAMAGLSAEDAAKLMPQPVVAAGGGGGVTKKKYYMDDYGYTYSVDGKGNTQYVKPQDVIGKKEVQNAPGSAGAQAYATSNPIFQLGGKVMNALTGTKKEEKKSKSGS